MKSHKKDSFLLQDISIIVISVLVAIILLKTRVLSEILGVAVGSEIIGSFVAGFFFTSIFTTAPAIVALGEIAQNSSTLMTAFFGSIGAVFGDILIFKFVKDRLSEHLVILLSHDTMGKRMRALFKLRYFRWLTFLMGGIVIASPLPDELGAGLLGFSKMKMKLFVLISFVFNFLGILVIGSLARAI
ncbi:MAG TPA: hypothetical protein VJG67_01345 [Candidatus Paceibacterota bacterium]